MSMPGADSKVIYFPNMEKHGFLRPCPTNRHRREVPRQSDSQINEESAMRTVSPFLSLPLLVLLATSAFSQAPSGENDRVSRRCTSATLNTDPAAPCPGDVLRDRPEPAAVPAPSDPLPVGGQGATNAQPLPGTPTTSGGTTPGTATTSGGITPGVPNTSVGAAPGTPATSVGTTPGVARTSAAPPGSSARTSRKAIAR